MTMTYSTGSLLVSVLCLLLTPVAGLLGDPCSTEIPCPPNEVCGSSATCVCEEGYAPIDSQCARECPQPGAVTNGNVTIVPNRERIEFEAIYTCIDGYELEGQPMRRCQNETGAWEGSAPTCRKKACPPLDQPVNGSFTYSDEVGHFGSEATYTCADGYEINGTETRQCQSDGQWSGTAPTCVKIVDPCNPNPCASDSENQQYACVLNTEDSTTYVCICPAGRKGTSCAEEDPPVTCKDSRIKRVYFENDVSLDDRTACMPKKGSTEANVCYNPNEDITYIFDDTEDISADDSRDDRFCVIYNRETPPVVAEICVNITAFEADDILYRPWINDTFEFCFKFNTGPEIMSLPESPLRYNVVHMPDTVTVILQTSDQDVNQTHTWEVSAVYVDVLQDKFSIKEDTLVITNPAELYSTNPDIFGKASDIEIKVTDSGVPPLDDVRNISVLFVYEKLTCTVPGEPFLVHLDPFPESRVDLGSIQCEVNGNSTTPVFETLNDSGPVVIEADGTIFYDPTANETHGMFNVHVKANTTLTLPAWTTFRFSVLARDLSPRCNRTDITDPIALSEKAEVGTCSSGAVYICDDPANLTKTCSVTSTLFDVQCSSVSSNMTEIKLCSAASLDLQAGKTETVPVQVTNKYGTASVVISVIVTNVNDPPTFLTNNSQINLEVSENTPLAAVIGEVLPVSDPDVGIDPPDNLSVTITDLENKEDSASLPFTATVNSFGNAVTVTLEKELTPKVRASYLLELKVEDSAGESDTVDLNITVKDLNEKPTCDSKNIETSATVRDAVDYVVTRLTCTDDDFSETFRTLTYSLEGDTSTTDFFKIDSSGVIQLKQVLTSFTNGTSLTFTARVTDGGGLSETVLISVNVITSYPPECDRFVVTEEKSEGTAAGECFLLAVNCTDPVQAETLSFESPSGNGSSLFTLKAESTTNNDISLCTVGSLQGKVGAWQINLVVSSSYGSRNIQIIIKVVDVNESPTCTRTTVDVTGVSVKTATDAEVTAVICSDPDVDTRFKTLTYSLDGQADIIAYFKMESNVVKLAKPLYNVTGTDNLLAFTVLVEDGGGLSASVSVEVTVANDFPPSCNSTEYEVTKSETNDADVCFGVEVGCKDPVRNEILSYYVTSGNGTSLFYEKDSTGSQITICTAKSLQGEYGVWQINAAVNSSYGETSFTLIIRVSDNNDPPVFKNTLYNSSVFENATINSVVLTVQASDQDSGAYGRITYQSRELDQIGLFSLDTNTGVISVNSKLDADRVASNSYSFVVQALDGGSIQLSATSTVSIQVLDVNDEVPVCKPPPDSLTIGLLTPVNTVLTQLDCSDADKTPEFQMINYKTTSTYFSVNSTGHVILSSELPRDETVHTIEVTVTDSDKPTDQDFTTSVSITVLVDNNVPPVCTQGVIVRSLKETEEIDVCLGTEVICTDRTGGEVTLQGQSGTARDEGLLVIKIHSEVGQLGLSACINASLKDKFGTFELIATISNGLGITTVNWTLTVENVNEPPVFNPDVYNISILENQPLNKEILKITVSDPDDGKGNANFELVNVTALSSNDAEFENALSDSILFLDAVRSFYALRPFNASRRNVYKYVVTAFDKSGLKSSATVTIRIEDVNSAPICEPSSLTGAIDILAKVNTLVATISCYDTDIKPEYVQLNYQKVSGDPDGYFGVSQKGEVTVQKTLPRELLYTTGKADIQFKISDEGTPPLSATVTVTVDVDNAISATCQPVVIPPDVWIRDKCVTIKMDCSDPTTAGTDHLQYSVSGNFSTDFTERNPELGTIELCYNLYTSGTYQVSVSVDNGLAKYTFSDVIVVSYSKASPVFSRSKYSDVISENTDVATIVMIVTASSEILVGSLEYRIINSESTEGWERYFSLDTSDGVIKTVAGIKDLANRVITLKVEAIDSVSRLRSSVPVELTVEDLNEPPSCVVSSTTLDLEVDAAVDTAIIVFECSDPDVKEEYKSLTYTMSGINAGTYFKLVGAPPTRVAVKTPLNVFTKEYDVTLSVGDNGDPPLTFTQDFKVSVNLLPPPVNVEAVALNDDTIRVTWNYARSDYYDVTNSFKVKALTAENIIVKESAFLDRGTRTYNITGLTEETEYIVVVEASAVAGTRSSKELRITTKEVQILKYFTFSVILEKDYNARLRDPGSQIYFVYKTEVNENFGFILKDTPGFVGITNVSFRPYNSVYADITGAVNQSGNVETTIQKLDQTVSTGWVKLLSVQSDYFLATEGVGYIIIDDLTFTPGEVYSGGKVDLKCDITAVGYPRDAQFTYWWSFQRNNLQPTSQSRYNVSVTTDQEIYEYKHSFLSIDPILSDQSGLYGCHVMDSANRQIKEKLIDIQVTSQPILYIDPISITVNFGENVTVTCGLAVSPGTFQGFRWFRNDNEFQQSSNEIVSSTSTTATLQVIGIRETVVYGCEGSNEAGTSERVYSNIGVIPSDPVDSDFCPVADDNRGTTWPVSAADTLVRINCESGFTGEIYRTCTAKGVWEVPVYNCVRRELQDIEKQATEIQDGFKSLNLTQVLVDLNQATASKTLFEGDIDTAINTLDILVGINDDTSVGEKATRKTNFIETCSSLIDDPNEPAWRSSIEVRQKGAIAVPKLVEDYNAKVLEDVSGTAEDIITVRNIHVMLGSGERDRYVFPDRSGAVPSWISSTKTGIVIQKKAFEDIPVVRYAGSFFRNITPILVKKLKKEGVVSDVSTTYDINSDIVAFQLIGNTTIVVDPPAEITFQHFDSNYSDPICCYWSYDESAFVTDGCSLVSTDDLETVCQCNHFTNFALLMSPGKTPEADVMALSIISAVGCGISILCLLVTIILYALVWRLVKSDRAVLLLNLCVALIISYIIFLAGVDRVENKNVCTAISALLHYFYLVVFFLMLAYGIEIGVSVIYVFVTRSRIRWLLPLAWGIPLAIVGISLGVTQLDGYGNERFCWLSTDDGLLWAFVGPAALIILVNFIIVIAVLRQMFKTSAMMTKSDREKAVTGVRSICVLLPILGLTWVFGVFSVNEDLVVFQYIFAICNTLQGFLIFLFHCIFNRQLKQALKQRRERKKSLATLENTFKNQHSTSGSTSYISSENKLNQNNDVIVPSSNPFLEADRQMKEMVDKHKKGANINDNLEANNKVEIDKSNKVVDLDDVKITNIIRESEVMGGVSGVSSILQAENRGADDKNKDTAGEVSRTSSHRYDYVDSYQPLFAHTTGIQKPPGYEKLLLGTSQGLYDSKDSVHSGSDRKREKENSKQREKEREREREIERERQLKIEKEKRERMEKERLERERMEKENEERERKEREQREMEKVIRIGYRNEGFVVADERRRDGSHERRGRPSRTDDDNESGYSAQNITSISTALPEKFELYQGKKRQQKEAKKQHGDSSLKKKEKKKSSLKDRSKAYEYPYESTYLGGQSRHASLENMNVQNYGYSPYAQMPGYQGYQSGRPVVQQQHWDPYGYPSGQRDPRDPYDPYVPYRRDPYRRDYW